MASKESRGEPICAICLEAPDMPEVLKVVTTCRHAFCRNCLSKHVESFGEAGKVFPCPTCQVECPLPEQGIEGLLEYNMSEVDDAGGKVAIGTIACLSCQYTNGTASEAKAFCQECGNAYFCNDCTGVHGRNEATSDHKVISLKSLGRKTGSRCRGHGPLINSYCCTCQEPCCYICVLLGHGDHEVKKIWEVFRSLLREVRCVTEDYERRSSDLKIAEGQLKFLSKSEVSLRRDALIQEIEGHAEQCIEKIIGQKDELKEKVRYSYKVVDDVSGWLGKVPELDKLTEILAKSTKTLTDSEPHPFDIGQLSRMKQRLTDSGFTGEIDMNGFFESYTRLFNNPFYFVPNESVDNIGDLKETTRKDKNIARCKLIFEKELVIKDARKYIPCVANLGNDFYAIAHPTIPGTPSNAIDVYKFPGDFQRTITDNVNSIHDMAATIEGHLAVLSDGVVENTCAVQLFDPEDGYVKSTADFPTRNPLSFDVNLRNQYAILSSDGNKKVSVVNSDGILEFTCDQLKVVTDATSISWCGIDKIVVMGQTSLVVFELNGEVISEFTKRTFHQNLHSTHISATLFGEIICCYKFNGKHKFLKNILLDKSLIFSGALKICEVRTGAAKSVACISVRDDDYIVSSQDHTIRVFKYDE
ncbi:uncharacterized protein LOC135492266 isoform X2 [Lineus longissimus]